jgi:hypothetical protein
MRGLYNSKYIGCSTQVDWNHVKNFNVQEKSHQIRHGIVIPTIDDIKIGEIKFREKFNITTKYIILTCGGFWRHKGMIEIADIFNKAITDKNITDINVIIPNNTALPVIINLKKVSIFIYFSQR